LQKFSFILLNKFISGKKHPEIVKKTLLYAITK
jgi:hypothetical protein